MLILCLGVFSVASMQSQELPTGQTPVSIVLHCPHLVDSVSGNMLGETTVVIAGDRVKEVVAGNESRPGATVIDLPGQTCIPGLIDMHVHLSDEFNPNATYERFHLNPTDHSIRMTVFAKRTLLGGSQRFVILEIAIMKLLRCGTQLMPVGFPDRVFLQQGKP